MLVLVKGAPSAITKRVKCSQFGAFTFVMVFGTAGCSAHAPRASQAQVATLSPADPPTFSAPVPLARGKIGECVRRSDTAAFTLVHVNDLQARYSERVDGKSRYARIAGLLRAIREEVPATLVVDAGDDYEKGSLLDVRTEGAATRQIVHSMPFDVRTLGNHDFAYGETAVREDVRESPHPVLAANVSDPEDRDLFRPYVTFEVGCVKVGVFGLVTRPYGSDDEQYDGGYGSFEHDARFVAHAQTIVRKLRGEVDVMIALSHLGKMPDVHIAREVPGIDVVVGGHSEDTISRPLRLTRSDGSNVVVVQAGRYGENVGRADIVVDLRARRMDVERYALLPIDARTPSDDNIDAIVTKLEEVSLPDLNEPLVMVAKDRTTRELVDLLAYVARQELGADAVVVGRDAFWGKLPAGPLTLQGLYERMLLQKQPVATPGFTSLYLVDVPKVDVARLKSRIKRATPFTFVETGRSTESGTKKTMTLAIEKRILEHPNVAFFGAVSFPNPRFGGELIDVFERFARAQRARSLSLDDAL